MHLHLKPFISSPSALDRLFAAIMDLLPFPNPVPVPISIREKTAPSDKIIPSLEYKYTPEELIDLAIESNISRINKRGAVGGDESFFIADLGQIARQHKRWKQNLPNVRPYYGTYTS